MISRDENVAASNARDDWSPGWDAIDLAFSHPYPGITPFHYGTELPARALLGGTDYLDGFSFFPSKLGFQHLVTYGMSVLYVDVESYGGEYSGWGYEMTMKIAADDPADCRWAVDTFGQLARYTYTSSKWFQPYQLVRVGGPIDGQPSTALTGYLVVPDTEVPGIDTVHGRVEFLQFVGITQREIDYAIGDGPDGWRDRGERLADLLAASRNPELVTDLRRNDSVV